MSVDLLLLAMRLAQLESDLTLTKHQEHEIVHIRTELMRIAGVEAWPEPVVTVKDTRVVWDYSEVVQ